MPAKASVIDLIALAARLHSRAAHFPRPHPTFPTTATRSTHFPRRRSDIATSSQVSRRQSLPTRRQLSTASRPPPPALPQSSASTKKPGASQAQTQSPSSTHINPIDPDLAASEAERIAFSSLAFTLSITNSGHPIYLSDLDSTAAVIDDARPDPPSLYLHRDNPEAAYPPDFEFAPLPFTTSIANTGSPIDEFDWNINSVDPGLVREGERKWEKKIFVPRSASGWEGIAIPSSTPAPEVPRSGERLIHPDFPARVTTTQSHAMSDADYSAFLEKQSGSGGGVQAQSAGVENEFSTSSTDTEVPPALQSIKAAYTSEADMPFKPVSLKLGDKHAKEGKISLVTFKEVSGHSHAESISQKDFDPQSQYKQIVKSVEEAGNGEAQFFRVELKGARVEYWIVSLHEPGSKMVGVKAASVES